MLLFSAVGTLSYTGRVMERVKPLLIVLIPASIFTLTYQGFGLGGMSFKQSIATSILALFI
jgi:hypothetical protein